MCIYCNQHDEEKKNEQMYDAFCDSLDLPTPLHDETYMPTVIRRLAEVGRRLMKNPNDNFALSEATRVVLNEVNLAQRRGDTYYDDKYSPTDTKGNKKEVSFKSQFFCQTDREDMIAIYQTEHGVVRGGIRSCGKAWTCPVCGAKIAVRRNEEVKQILKKAHKMRKNVFLLTLTAPHYKDDKINSLTHRIQNAYKDFKNARNWRDNIAEKYHLFGTIRALETTLGGINGAHNHFHVILIFDMQITKATQEIIRMRLLAGWMDACLKNNLLDITNKKQCDDFVKNAVDIKKDFDPEYIAKQGIEWQHEMQVFANWTASEELSLSHMRKTTGAAKTISDAGSFTPFGFVARMAIRVARGDYSMVELAEDCETFIAYAFAMHGRSQIHFSPGLRKWAELKEKKTDKDLCDEMQDEGVVIGGFDRKQHRFIRKNMAWKTIKTAIEKNGPKVLESVSLWFLQNGLRPVYSATDAQLYEKSRHGVSTNSEFDFDRLDALLSELQDVAKAMVDDDACGESVRELAEKEKEEEKRAEEEARKPVQLSLDFGLISLHRIIERCLPTAVAINAWRQTAYPSGLSFMRRAG